MKIPEDPWIVMAAEKWIELRRARRAQPHGRGLNGEPEHVAYSEALDGAYSMEGLKPWQSGLVVFYGTPEQQSKVNMRVMMTAVELVLDGEEGCGVR